MTVTEESTGILEMVPSLAITRQVMTSPALNGPDNELVVFPSIFPLINHCTVSERGSQSASLELYVQVSVLWVVTGVGLMDTVLTTGVLLTIVSVLST